MALLLAAVSVGAKDYHDTTCLREEFDLITVVDLDAQSFDGVRDLLERGDTAGAEGLIWEHFQAKSGVSGLAGLGVCPEAVERADGILANRYRFWTYDEYELPEDLSWKENPPASRNWSYYLLSFEFLWILNEAYVETGNRAYLEKARVLIEDFARDNLDPEALPARLSWYDHSAANRLVYLVDFWFLYHSADTPSPGFTSLVLELLWRHARFLMEPDNYNYKTNHGLFSCLALERLALAFPEMEESDKFLEHSISRFKKQLEDNFDGDGIFREHSPWYQIWVAGLLKVYADDCGRNGAQLPGSCIESIDRAIYACGYFFHPDWTIALFGDSDLYPTEKMMDIALNSHPELKYIYTKGREGQRPEKHSAGFADVQIYIMRSGWGERRATASESCLIAFFTAAATNHDHDDLMGFEFYSRGAKWITDLGRYNYNETSEEREYIISARAHNTIVPYRIVTPAASTKKPEYRGDLESALEKISLEKDPGKRADSFAGLLKTYEAEEAMRIKFLLAFVLAEELGDNEAAALQLKDIIRDSTNIEHINLAEEYLHTLDISGTEMPRPEKESERALSPPDGHEKSSRSRDIEKNSALQEYKPPLGMGPEILTWISNTNYDYLEGCMQYGYRMFCHNRAILFIKPSCCLIVDRLVAKEKLHVKQHFHFSPDVSVTDKGDFRYILESAQGQFCIMKAVKPFSSGKTEIIRGRTKPEYQGWYSGAFNDFVPAAVLENQAAFLGETYVIYLFVPTGQENPSSFRIAVSDRGFADNSNEAIGQLRLEIDTPQQKIEINYVPSARFLDSKAGESGAPKINIVKKQK